MKILPIIMNSFIPKRSIENYQYDNSQQRMSLLRSPNVDTFTKTTFTSARGPESVSPSREPLEKLYKHHLTCLCCGREMIDPKEIKALEEKGVFRHQKIDKEPYDKGKGQVVVPAKAPHAIEILSKYEGNMHSVEKEVFNILKEQAKLHPDKDLHQILVSLKPQHEKPLIATQFGIFKLIEMASENIKPELKKEIKALIEEEKAAILAGNNQFRRKRFVNKFETILEGGKNSATKEHLIRLANKLPTAYEDKNAFIVKYASRSQEAIALRLLSYSACTIEHVTPKNPKTTKGENHIFNYIPECMRCNSFRQDRPMIQQLEEHPEMFFNAQKLMNQLIGFANAGQLNKWYIIKIQERVKSESQGLLDLDISALNMPKKMQREYARMHEAPAEGDFPIEKEMAEIRKNYRGETTKRAKQVKAQAENVPAKKTRKERLKEKIKQRRIEQNKHKKESSINHPHK